jgi:hypothetical protein
MIELDDKVVARRARVTEKIEAWNERTSRLFAADCAERVLYLYEQEYPNDDRPRAAIQAARDFAEGRIDQAALDAARVAASAAERDAAWDAAWTAARAAAWAAARDAGVTKRPSPATDWISRWGAEREWQARRLLEYLEQ